MSTEVHMSGEDVETHSIVLANVFLTVSGTDIFASRSIAHSRANENNRCAKEVKAEQTGTRRYNGMASDIAEANLQREGQMEQACNGRVT